jgi:hypothetical protein
MSYAIIGVGKRERRRRRLSHQVPIQAGVLAVWPRAPSLRPGSAACQARAIVKARAGYCSIRNCPQREARNVTSQQVEQMVLNGPSLERH